MAEPTSDDAVRAHLVAALRLARMLVSDGSAEDIAAESVARLLAARRKVRVDNADAYLRRIVVKDQLSLRQLECPFRDAVTARFASAQDVKNACPQRGDGRGLTGFLSLRIDLDETGGAPRPAPRGFSPSAADEDDDTSHNGYPNDNPYP